MIERVAYQGSVFCIEWYFDEKKHSQALDYFLSQPKEMQRKLLNLLRLMGDHGKIFDETKFRNEGDYIYAFKPQPDRYLCFFLQRKENSFNECVCQEEHEIASWRETAGS